MTVPATDAVPPAQPPQAAPAPPRVPGPDAEDMPKALARAMAARGRAQWLIRQSEELVAQARILTRAHAESRHALAHGQPSQLRREALQWSRHLRLLAQLETMPVIEQAKGILMVQSGCNEAEAFDLLRRASQRGNMPVRELAAQLVANTVRASQITSKAG